MKHQPNLHVLAIAIGLAATTVALASSAWGASITFVNGGAISIPAYGPAVPYPTSINVAGITDSVLDVNITLGGVTHTYADDIYVVLEGPTGAALVLWNDAGGGTPIVSADITFDDEAAGPIADNGPVGTGSYRVSHYSSPPAAVATAPAPYPGLGGTLGLFDGLDPNGTWNLWIFDDKFNDSGRLASGWSITFETGNPIPEPSATLMFALGTFVVGGTLRRRRS